jgi:hypothetical protein
MMNVERARGWLVLSVLIVGQSACTSMLPLEAADAEALLAVLEAGDRLSVLDSSGVTTELVVTAVGAGFVEGMVGRGGSVRIAAAEIEEIREQKFAPGKTAGLAAGLSLLLFGQGLSAAGTMGVMQ